MCCCEICLVFIQWISSKCYMNTYQEIEEDINSGEKHFDNVEMDKYESKESTFNSDNLDECSSGDFMVSTTRCQRQQNGLSGRSDQSGAENITTTQKRRSGIYRSVFDYLKETEAKMDSGVCNICSYEKSMFYISKTLKPMYRGDKVTPYMLKVMNFFKRKIVKVYYRHDTSSYVLIRSPTCASNIFIHSTLGQEAFKRWLNLFIYQSCVPLLFQPHTINGVFFIENKNKEVCAMGIDIKFSRNHFMDWESFRCSCTNNLIIDNLKTDIEFVKRTLNVDENMHAYVSRGKFLVVDFLRSLRN